MPPCLDVYAWTDTRGQATLDRFLGAYVDVDASRDRAGEELAVLPLDYDGDPDELSLADWDNVPVATLDEIVTFGLAAPHRAFTVYLRARPELCGAMICFTKDGGLILGLSVDDELGDPVAVDEARALMVELVERFRARHGWVVAEEGPPLDPASDQPWTRALAATD